MGGVGYKMINFLIVTGIVIIMAWLITVYRLDQKKSNLLMVIGGIVCIALFVYTEDWQTALICIIGSVVAAFCFPKSKNMWEMFGMKRTIIILSISSMFILFWLIDLIPRMG